MSTAPRSARLRVPETHPLTSRSTKATGRRAACSRAPSSGQSRVGSRRPQPPDRFQGAVGRRNRPPVRDPSLGVGGQRSDITVRTSSATAWAGLPTLGLVVDFLADDPVLLAFVVVGIGAAIGSI